MNQLRTELDASIGVPPVSTIDIDRTVSRMRRVVRLRRAAGTAVAILTVTALGAGVASYLGPSSTGDLRANLPATSAVPEAEPAKIARLDAALGSLMQQAFPDAQFVANLPNYPVGPFEFYAVHRPEAPPTTPLLYLHASADVHDAQGVGTVTVLIGRYGYPPSVTPSCTGTSGPGSCATPGPVAAAGFGYVQSCSDAGLDQPDPTRTCSTRSGPHGESAVVTTRTEDTSREVQVDLIRPDGTVLILISQNWGQIGATNKVSAATRPAPPLTVDQLIALGSDPSLDLRS